MPSLFAITAPTNSVNLRDRRGEAAFVVFNASGRPVRGRAVLIPEGGAADGWFSITGEAEQEFAIAGTAQYTVQVAIPPDVPSRNFSFRLDMVNVDNPDEDYTQGQTVTFEVTEAEQGWTLPIPWWVLVAALALLVAVVALIVLLFILFRGCSIGMVSFDLEPGKEETFTLPLPDSGPVRVKVDIQWEQPPQAIELAPLNAEGEPFVKLPLSPVIASVTLIIDESAIRKGGSEWTIKVRNAGKRRAVGALILSCS